MSIGVKIICLGLSVMFILSVATQTVGQESSTGINWVEAKAIELDKKARKDSTIFQDFDELSGKRKKEPIMIYFYWPEPKEDEKPKSKEKKQLALCKMIEDGLFKDNSFIEIANEFITIKVNLKELHKDLTKKYKVKYAPYILMFDCLGKKVGKIDNPKQDIINLIIGLREIISNSEEKRKSDE